MNKLFLICFTICLASCATSGITISESSYQYSPLGTEILIEMANVPTDAEITSVVFNRKFAEVTEVQSSGNTTLVSATIAQDAPEVDLPNQVNYIRNGKEAFYQLTNWVKKPILLQ